MTANLVPPRKTGGFSRLGLLIPGLILLAGLMDLALRFVPPRFIAFRAWEAMMLFVTADGPFVPNQRYDNPRSFGDLANLRNLPDLRQYRHEIFTTDAHGFRNQPMRQAPRIILLGDSFAAGSGVSDEDTLSQQLGRLQGEPVYNAAQCESDLEAIEACIAASGTPGGLVIWQVSERHAIPRTASGAEPQSMTERLESAFVNRLPKNLRREAQTHRLGADLRYSPLRIAASRTYRRLQNDSILPNPYQESAVIHTLRNGRPMLFLPRQEKRESPFIDTGYAREVNSRLQAMGLRLLVLIVPDKYTVYFPLLRNAPATPIDSSLYLNRLEASFSAAGLAVVNLTGAFQAGAAEALSRGEYIYWLDDTHWNQAGIRIAAEQLSRRIAAWQ